MVNNFLKRLSITRIAPFDALINWLGSNILIYPSSRAWIYWALNEDLVKGYCSALWGYSTT